MNFTYSVVKPKDGQFGSKNTKNGTWSGVIQMLQNREIDLAPMSFLVTLERNTVVSFSSPITYVFNTLFIKYPISYDAKAYLEPLHYLSWIFLFVFCLIAPIFLVLAIKWSFLGISFKYSIIKSYFFFFSILLETCLVL